MDDFLTYVLPSLIGYALGKAVIVLGVLIVLNKAILKRLLFTHATMISGIVGVTGIIVDVVGSWSEDALVFSISASLLLVLVAWLLERRADQI